MRSQLSQKMMCMVDEELKVFFDKMEKKYRIPTGSLWNEWEDTETATTTVVAAAEESKKDNKKSNYQVFFSIQRNKIMKENPNMTFGEISKKVSAMWKQVPAEEKKRYVQEDGVDGNLDQLSIKDLKKICKDKSIQSKNMKKEDMIQALSSKCQKGKITDPVLISLKPASHSRSKLEISISDDKEEEDFFFEDELNSERGLEDEDIDEADMNDDCDEDDIFEEPDD